MPRTMVLLVLTLWAGSIASGQVYSGPKCFGLFCIDHEVPARSLFKQLGPPSTRASRLSPYCYQSRDGRMFLYMETFDSEPDRVADIFLSDFPNCMRAPKKITEDDLRSWETKEGIRLGSSEADVLKAYGKPSWEGKVDAQIYRLRIRGHRPVDKTPQLKDIGDKRIFYNAGVSSDDPSAAESGMRDGKVSWISLSINE